MVDGRGTPYLGDSFGKKQFMNIGEVESDDQVCTCILRCIFAGALALVSLCKPSWPDDKKLAVWICLKQFDSIWQNLIVCILWLHVVQSSFLDFLEIQHFLKCLEDATGHSSDLPYLQTTPFRP